MTDNRAAFVMKNRSIQVMDAPAPVVRPGDVLLRMVYCGVCGSDVHFYEHGEPDFPDVYPFILGHEAAAEVAGVGPGVTTLSVGDRVAIEVGIPCRICEWCTTGKYNLCQSIVFLSAPRAHGVMQQYIAHPADLCYKLPDHVSTLEGALIEPLAVGLTAVLNTGARVGQSAAILGSGCIGLVTLLSLRAMGIENITVVDVFDIRLAKAKELGATSVVNASKVDAVEAVCDLHGGIGPDYVFEAAGNRVTAGQTIPMAKRGGTIAIIGNVVGQTPMDLQLMTNKELRLLTSFRYRNIYPTAIASVASGKINISTIVSREYPFTDAGQAFEDSISQKQAMVKAVIKIAD
jgi:L-iditol 2-dehydrogenase